MDNDLEKALQSFCLHLPSTKVGVYSHNSHDDTRLAMVAYHAYLSCEEITSEKFTECLSSVHPDVLKADIEKCVNTCLPLINQMKEVIRLVDRNSLLIK